MKKNILIAAIIVSALSISACSGGVSTQEHESVSALASQLSQEIAALKENVQALENEKNSLNDEFSAYKESMSTYEGLVTAEAQARQIEADAIIASKAVEESIAAASKAAEEEAVAAAAKAQKEAEENAGYETGITYDQLARTPDDYKNKKVKFFGKVLQVMEGSSDSNQIRLAVNSDYDTILYCEYNKSITPSRILDDDKVTIYGTSYGLYSYEATGGATITLPAVIIDKIEQ